MTHALPDRALKLSLVAFAAGALLHIDRVPLWCGSVAVVALLWRLAHLRGRLPLPNFVMRMLLVMALTAATLATFRTLNGLAAGSALLMAMGAAKVLETRQRRDAMVLVLTTLVLLLAACLDRQGLLRLPLYLLTGWICCASLVSLGSSTHSSSTIPGAFRVAGRSLLWSLPFAAILFLFVPRLPGALWSLPGDERAQTGLSDQMSPGSISDLAISDEIAFRVRFTGAVPRPYERYWRGPVLHNFDGYTWTRGPAFGVRVPAEPVGAAVTYEVMLEPSNRNWLFGLDTVTGVSRRGVFLTYDGQMLSNRPVTSPTVYQAESHLTLQSPGPLPLTARRVDTRLPDDRNPRTRELALQMRREARDERAFIADTLDYFRDGGFRYTLTPPLLNQDSIDDLLFNTRLGFCGHFASAFVSLMRAAGIPARVVTGYQGGDWNSLSGYFIVRQSAAHAWAEVWIEGSGWQRVDPTAVVAPQRLELGLDDLLPGRRNATDRFFQDSQLLRNLADVWDASNLWWQSRVINFNEAVQLDLMRRLGLGAIDWRGLSWLLMGGTAAWALIAGLWIGRSRRVPADPIASVWQDFRQLLRQRGLEVESHEPPRALARRAAAGWPGAVDALQGLSQSYLRARYGADGSHQPSDARDLARQLKHVRAAIGRNRPLDSFADLGEVPVYQRLPLNLRLRVSALATDFLRTVRIEGCGGLVLTAYMRRVIAFQACVPIANLGAAFYAELRSVLVYPGEFVVPQESEDEAGVVTRGHDALSGQTEDASRVLLSWSDVERGFAEASGYNVVLHEFAHIIDHALDGRLTRREGGDGDWHAVLHAEFDALCLQVDAGAPTLIDPYGAEDPVEFFAVCTETFFELPLEMAKQHAALYAALCRLYRLDPAAWSDAASTA